MTDTQSFDPSLYVRAPIISLASGLSLARALLAAQPAGLPAAAKKASDALRSTLDSAESAWVARQRAEVASSDISSRQVDQLSDQAWAALRGRLDSYALLPGDDFPLSLRAAELILTLFPDGLSFLKLSYAEQAATTSALLRRIDEDGLARDLDAICGPEFLRQVRKLQPRYDAMVQAQLTRQEDGPDLSSQVRALSRAIVTYATRVAASVEDDDPKTLVRARDALRPLDQFRAQTLSDRKKNDPTPEGPAAPPTPDSPAAPPVAP
ncbi:MAG TPA: hypothetical protein PKI03_12820 [Pseudomonadota bacterium]|nr:hypothetical protein [Pseudomonadota bacterium]